MRPKLIWMPLLGTIVMAIVANVGRVQATPAAGFTGTTLALGRFDNINALNHQVLPDAQGRRQPRISGSPPEDERRLRPVRPEQHLGCRRDHRLAYPPGHSLIIVTAGTVTAYEGDDPTCTPHVYTQGWALSMRAETTCT